ncbi:M10 family metallopeptidase C-terminal domain-containing protein, partial [Rhabdaerophilum sp.]|uniref:M10 family metallopeptidase C-terminal domain-containing protein n=1 Tax=Rhabdaerophilum sp. TaxID=2717341 RepID=UPI0038D4EACB
NPLSYQGSSAAGASQTGTSGTFSSSAQTPQPGGSGSNFWAFQGSTGNQNVDGLLSGSRWGGSTLTYSFPTVSTQYESSYSVNNEPLLGFQTATEALKVATRSAMNLVSQDTNLVTTEVSPTITADIRSGFSYAPSTAWAYYPSDSKTGGDVWYGRGYTEYQNPIKGQYAGATVLHELGHSLGLKHGHQFGGPANTAMQAEFDQMSYSVMTYRSYLGASVTGGYTNELNGYAQTYMMYDIASLQTMYGANFNTNSGNTTYSWSATTGEMFINGVGQGAPGGNRIFLTVWDGNGIDTYDFSNYTTNLSINLAPGNFSITSSTQLANLGDGRYAPGNVFNALQFNGDARSLIENAIGGSGNDTIVGNSANNTLNGGGGNDTLIGGAGADALIGGAGADALIGGSDWDTANYFGSSSGITVGMTGWANTGDAAGDTFSGVEGIFATNFSDLIGGDSATNALYGNDGDDGLWGYGDVDYLYGGNGNDSLNGGPSGDLIDGGSGWDTVSYDAASSGVVVGLSNWTNFGEAAGDTFVSVEGIYASDFADLLGGDGNSNAIYGRGGSDSLWGYGSTDYLYGGAGDDQLYGGTGGDLLDGGAGLDVARYDEAWSGVVVGLRNWVNFGEAAGDTFTSIEGVSGSQFSDQIGGDNEANTLFGRGGNDTIWAYGGNDQITGGTGEDYIITDAGNDTIYWRTGDGNDFIADFTGGLGAGDVLNLAGSGVTSFSQLQGLIVQTANTNQSEIRIGSEVIYVWGILPGQFAADDFAFV